MSLDIIQEYSVIISEVTPKEKVSELSYRNRCYTGISIANPFCHGEYLYTLLSWINTNFSECTILIDDYFHRFNAMSINGLSENGGLLVAQELANLTESEVRSALTDLATDSEFKIMRSSQIARLKVFEKYHQTFKNLFNNNELFRLSVQKTATDYIERQIKKGIGLSVSKERAIELSVGYILEEIAAFTVLCDNSYDVEVYPGKELPVLVDIAKGKIAGIPSVLSNRINIELKIVKE